MCGSNYDWVVYIPCTFLSVRKVKAIYIDIMLLNGYIWNRAFWKNNLYSIWDYITVSVSVVM